jgi:glyoxalase superfamily protein/ClpA/ClpB-like protein
MRDFRDAKAMARTLRAALAAKDIKITVGQSLELIAEAFGMADWNTLAAAIRAEALASRKDKMSELRPPTAEVAPRPRFSAELEVTLHRALIYADQRKHRYSTLEHLLLALIDDADASATMRVSADLGAMKHDLISYLDSELGSLVIDDDGDPKPTAAFQRVVQRAVNRAQVLGHPMVTGVDTLVGLFPERLSYAVRLLGVQAVIPPKVAN